MDLVNPHLATMGLWMYFWTEGDWGGGPPPGGESGAGKYIVMEIIKGLFWALLSYEVWRWT